MSTPWEPSLSRLRARRSEKWTTYAPDVLPLPVAESDVRLAAPIADALHAAVERSDTGYAGDPTGFLAAFAGFAARRWGWEVDPDGVRTCADVAMGVTEVLRLVAPPGERVLLSPPVYPPFWQWLKAAGVAPVEVPLRPDGRLDLDGIADAATTGIRALLLCHPQNPTGRVNTAAELRALATLAARYGILVLSDEIHAPLTLPGVDFAPYLTVSPEAAATGIAFHSASKAWNLAGLKSALIVAAGAGPRAVLERLSPELHWTLGQFGLLAATAAYCDGEPWLDGLRAALASNVELLAELLAAELPAIRLLRPQSTYLAWLDCRPLGLGDDPAAAFLDRGRVALSSGPNFGTPGLGHARVNLACHPDVLREAVRRMATAMA